MSQGATESMTFHLGRHSSVMSPWRLLRPREVNLWVTAEYRHILSPESFSPKGMCYMSQGCSVLV